MVLPDLAPFFDPTMIFLAVASGLAVGASLGLTGGGGSVLAVPLLVYVIGIKEPHVAIGTSALMVGLIASASMVKQRLGGHLKLKEGLMFAAPGIGGVLLGAQMGMLTPPSHLLLFFAAFMMVMAYRTYTRKPRANLPENQGGTVLLQRNRAALAGFLSGTGAGYFGIGGGFIIVPALMHSLGLGIVDAIGTSLLPVSAFGLSTAARYLTVVQFDWLLVIPFVAGGIAGGFAGARFSSRISQQKLLKGFGMLMFLVAAYIAFRAVIS